MGIILGELAHPQKAVHDAAFFMAVHHAEFKHAEGQIPVTAGFGAVDQHV